jgi:hypothetical protein
MISDLKVGMRVMLNKDRLGNTRVLDSSSVKHTTPSSCSEPYDSTCLQRCLPFLGDSELPARNP